MNMFQNYASKIIEIHNRTDIDIDTIVETVLDLAKSNDYTFETVVVVILSLLGEGKTWENAIKEFDKYIPTIPICGVTFAEAEKGFNQLKKVLNGEIEIKLGDKVIRKDGLVGKVESFYDNIPVVLFENNTSAWINSDKLDDYYLIGKTVLGNKIDEEELQRQLDEQWDKCEVEQAKYDQLRKQLWYLKNRMVEDWQERKAEAEKNTQEKVERNTEKPPKQAQKGEKDNRLIKYKG